MNGFLYLANFYYYCYETILITLFFLALFHSFMVFIMADTLDSGGQEYNKMEISLTEFVKLSY